jgi:hypothetical protein
MKTIPNRIVLALFLVMFASPLTFAKVHKGTIKLEADTKVGDVVVKKGTYDARFDDESGEVSILKKKEVIAKSAAQTEPLSRKYDSTAVIVNSENAERKLTGIIFGGTSQTVVLKGTQAASKN